MLRRSIIRWGKVAEQCVSCYVIFFSFFKNKNGIYKCIHRLLKGTKDLERMQFTLLMVFNLDVWVWGKELKRVKGIKRVLEGDFHCLFDTFYGFWTYNMEHRCFCNLKREELLCPPPYPWLLSCPGSGSPAGPASPQPKQCPAMSLEADTRPGQSAVGPQQPSLCLPFPAPHPNLPFPSPHTTVPLQPLPWGGRYLINALEPKVPKATEQLP